jgi:uncharacterized membrane protein YebE (DUF533 family)
MALKTMLDELLRAGKDLASQGQSFAERQLDVPQQGPERDQALSNLGKGALGGGALALLLGTKAGRRLAGTGAALGGIGLLGKVAYDAYGNWKAKNAQAPAEPGTPVGLLTGNAAEQRSLVLLRAMIAAAKADGHIDDAERENIHGALVQLGLDNDSRTLLEAELARPVDVLALASAADSTETAAEIYLASLFVIDVDAPEERRYLDHLAGALRLDPGLAGELEAQARAG